MGGVEASVIRDSGTRALLPPFGDEHVQLRETIRRWVREEIVPARRRLGAGARVSARALRPGRGARLPRAQVPGRARRAGRRLRPRRGLGRGAGRGGGLGRGRRRARRSHRDRDAARVQASGPPTSTSASCAPRSAARKIAALGITEPGAGSDVASIRTARRVDGGWVVNGSKTFITNGVRADFLVCAVKTTARRRPPRDLVPDPRARDAGLRGDGASSRRSAGTPPTPASSRSPTSRSRRRTCSAPKNGGFYLIMANFQWERLLMALGAVGGMQRLLEAAIAYASSARRSAARSASSRRSATRSPRWRSRPSRHGR